jgi:hypothetical protein
MLKFDNFEKLASIQASVFILDENYNSAKYLKKIYQNFSDTFDGEPTVFPLPEGAPPEIPRIIVTTKDNGKKLEISPIKITYFQNITSEDDIVDFECFMTATNFIKEIVNSNGVKCNRLAGVVSRYVRNEEAGRMIASHFCKESFMEGPFNRPNEFHIYSHKSYNFLDQYDVNSWVRVRNGLVTMNNKKDKSIIVEQDINTLVETSHETDFSGDEIDFFFSNIGSEFDKILYLYFPKK